MARLYAVQALIEFVERYVCFHRKAQERTVTLAGTWLIARVCRGCGRVKWEAT